MHKVSAYNYDYVEIERFLSDCKQEYLRKMRVIIDGKMDNDVTLRRVHRDLVDNVLRRIAKYIERVEKQECLMFLYGSFARGTNRITSDIDLSVILPHGSIMQRKRIIEIAAYAIMYVFGLERYHIHSYLFNQQLDMYGEIGKGELKYLPIINFDKTNVLLNPGLHHLLWTEYNLSEDYRAVCSHIARNSGKLKEYAFFFRVLSENQFSNCFNDFLVEDFSRTRKKILVNEVSFSKDQLLELNRGVSVSTISVSDLKKHCKAVTSWLYENFVYYIASRQTEYVKVPNMLDFYVNNYSSYGSHLVELTLAYLRCIEKLEDKLKDKGIRWSQHNHTCISIDEHLQDEIAHLVRYESQMRENLECEYTQTIH